MAEPAPGQDTELEAAFWRLYRDFFDKAEKRRRWSIPDDIPWNQCNRHLHPAVADVVESFCAVELYLPDYIAKALPMIRANRGWAWFHANWGYEESKHSLAMSDWLLHSGMRTEEQLAEICALGVRHVVNLALHTHEKALPDEAASVSRLGMTYIHIPVDFQNPTDQDFDQFCSAMEQLKDVPVHVHCIANYRVSAFFYRYRRDVLGMDEAEARADMEDVWHPEGVWATFVGR